MPDSFISPDWPAPAWVQACTTTRAGGVSVDGQKVSDVDLKLSARSDAYVIRVGKRRFAGVVVT